MDFPTAIVTGLRKYADFTGKATRPEFWWFILFTTIVTAVLTAFNGFSTGSPVAVGTTLASVWSLVVLVPTLAVLVRRLRDVDRDWREVFWLLVPIAGLIVLAIHLAEPSRSVVPTEPQPAASA